MLKKIFFIKFRVLLKESACYSAGFNVGNTVCISIVKFEYIVGIIKRKVVVLNTL